MEVSNQLKTAIRSTYETEKKCKQGDKDQMNLIQISEQNKGQFELLIDKIIKQIKQEHELIHRWIGLDILCQDSKKWMQN